MDFFVRAGKVTEFIRLSLRVAYRNVDCQFSILYTSDSQPGSHLRFAGVPRAIAHCLINME